MKIPWQTIVQPTIEEILRTASVPGIVIALAQEDGSVEHLVLGTDGQASPLRADTLFPIASITKLATALAILRLAAAGALRPDDPLVNHLPNAAAARKGVTLRTLLSHTSGLPDDVPPELAPYAPELDWPTLARACLATPLTPDACDLQQRRVWPACHHRRTGDRSPLRDRADCVGADTTRHRGIPGS